MNCSCSDTFIFCGRRLAMLDSVVHLGSYLTVNLLDLFAESWQDLSEHDVN